MSDLVMALFRFFAFLSFAGRKAEQPLYARIQHTLGIFTINDVYLRISVIPRYIKRSDDLWIAPIAQNGKLLLPLNTHTK